MPYISIICRKGEGIDKMRLKILHTNDVHSNFSNFAKAASVIKEHLGKNTLVFDAGDFADFKSIELQGTKGIAAVKLLEHVGYDALTVGNNEMFKWLETLEHMATNSKVPLLSCNVMTINDEEVQGVKKSIILSRGGIRILVIGTSPSLGEFDELLGFKLNDYKVMIQKEIESNKGKYDICILTNHIGTVRDEELAREIKGIDIIISGHDHQLYTEAKLVGNTIINSAGSFAEHVGYIEIEYINNKVKLLGSGVIRTADYQDDNLVIELLAEYKQKAIENLSHPLFKINRTLWHDVIEENPISNLLADGLKDMLNCDIGLINSGIVNGGVMAGNVTEKKLIEICPSPLNPTYFEIQGKYLKEAIEKSIDAQVCLDNGNGAGFRGKYLGRLHVSGVTIEYKGNMVTRILVNNEELIEDKWYTIASSDYLHRGSGYTSLANNQNVEYRAEYIRDLLREYLSKEDFVERAFTNRWIEAEK